MLLTKPESPQTNPKQGQLARRTFLFATAMALVGCGTKKVNSALPSPIWSASLTPELKFPAQPASLPEARGTLGAISRSTWAKGQPIPNNMNHMLPVRYITIHHDGMRAPFTSTSKSSTATRLETIRKSHLRRDGGRWGDIGYHFAIDPAGRVWQGRPLMWQGAHVKAPERGEHWYCCTWKL